MTENIIFISGCSQITCIDAGPLRSGGNNGDRYANNLSSNSRPQLYLQLQYLDLTDCVSLEDTGIQMIVRSCAQLTCLYLRRCVHITGKIITFVHNTLTIINLFVFFSICKNNRFGSQVFGQLLHSVARAEHIGLRASDGLWDVRTGPFGPQFEILVGSQMRPDIRRRNQADWTPLLQVALSEPARLRSRQRRLFRSPGPHLLQAEGPGSRQVRHHRSGPSAPGRALSQSQETQREIVRARDGRRCSIRRLLLPRIEAAQHPGLPHHGRRVPGRQKVLSQVHNRTHQPGILLTSSTITRSFSSNCIIENVQPNYCCNCRVI